VHSTAATEAVAAAALAVVPAWAVRRPRGWPEATAAVPAALLVVLVRAEPAAAALGVRAEHFSWCVTLQMAMLYVVVCATRQGTPRPVGCAVTRDSLGSPDSPDLLTVN